MTGPIYIEAAKPGDILEVRLEAVTPRLPIGFTLIRPGSGGLPQKFDQPKIQFTPIDLANRTVEFPPDSGITFPIKPLFGIMGVATDDPHRHSVPPGDYGGNMDNQWLQAPCRLFLPIFLPGARFSIGDGHTIQGDGEACATALETSMNGTIRLRSHRHLTHLSVPLAETQTDWITMGFGTTFDAAFEQSLERMMNFLQQSLKLSAEDAYMLCSLGVHFHITQAVNLLNKGVHACLPKAILPQAIEI